MAAKLLHSLTDDNIDLQKQIGCMNGIFQLFDRHHTLTGGGRRMVGHTSKRGVSGLDGDTLERESSNGRLRSSSEKYSHKNIQEKQRISTESSRASFSSLSPSSSFSSLDCNRAPQLEPASFDRIIFPETPSKDPTMSLQGLSPHFSKQSRDLRDLVKDSMYREHGFPGKPKTADRSADPVTRRRDSHSENTDGSSVLAKLQESPWYHNEPRTLLRSSSYHSKDGSSFPTSRDAPRFSYDGREVNRAPFDARNASKHTLKLKDLPRLSLDSKAGSMRSLHESYDNLQQTPARPPSVVAKLMGLTALPDSVSSHDTNSVSTRSYADKDFVTISRSFAERDATSVQQSSSSKKSWKEPSSPRWRSPDSSMKPMSRFPIEPAPWKHIDGRKPIYRTKRAPAKAETTFPSVYSEIEKRLKDLEFTQSAKDLRALKQILETMQSKGFLQTENEVVGLDFTSENHLKEKYLNSKHEARSADHRKPHSERVLVSTKRRTVVERHIESPIVIMKPAKVVMKSVIPVDGLSGVPRTARDVSSKHSVRDNAVNSANMKNERPLKTTQTSRRPQQLAKDENVGPGKTSGTISPRLQQKKIELEKRSRPPTPPDSSKSRRQPSKPQIESNSPGGRRRSRHPNIQESGDKLSEVNVESRNMNFHENENSVSEKSNGSSSCQSPCMKASGSVEKNPTVALSEEESADFGSVPVEYSSPVSVLDDIVHKLDSPSPVKYTRNTMKVDGERDWDAVQETSLDIFAPNSNESGSEMNQKKLEKIENLVQKLRRLNSSHDEARTDYIASLCENTNPDDRYISEILLASGLLLRDLGSSLTNFQFHPSGHPINPELFLVLEQTKTSSLVDSPETKTQLGKIHRKLIFDSVNEILARKLASPGPSLRPVKRARRALNAQKLLRELCYEIEVIQAKNPKCSFDEDDDDKRWKDILYKDVMHHETESWINFDDEISGAVLDIERSIFKDLVNEIVIGESAGLKSKQRLFAN
ncbi:hypothetical protein ACS0TY_035480 [Phlomoides rotata]